MVRNGAVSIRAKETEPAPADRLSMITAAHLKLVQHFVRSRIKSEADVEDICQDTLLLACRNIAHFRFEASLGTWLCCIALNVIRGRWRRKESKRVAFVDPEILEWLARTDPRRTPLMEVLHNELHGRLYSAVAKLPSKYRTVVELHDFQGLSLRETAERLTSSVPAIKSRHLRAKGMLHEELSEAA
jgi:RNA polymerase sigma-70 factor, ECF subfamily